MSRPPELLIVAGEVSGDMHAARLLEAIRRLNPEVRAFGIGGDRLRAAGMEILFDVRETAVMGFVEVAKRLPFFRRMFRSLVDEAGRRRPDAVILVDYPGFNLRFAARAHAMGLKVIYYICPQVWAWNRGRIPKMAANVDRLLAIFPFEKDVFAGTKMNVEFVGHPLVDDLQAVLKAPPVDLPWAGTPRIALLPGSRAQEIERILPTLREAALRIERQRPGAAFIIPTPSPETGNLIRARLAALGPGPARLSVVDGATREVLRQAQGALVTSGTATLEAALLDCPTVVVYKAAPLSYLLARLLIRIPHIGIVNVVAGRRVCPELIQGDATPDRLADAILPLVDDGPARDAMLAAFREVRESLGTAGASERAAAIVLRELQPTR